MKQEQFSNRGLTNQQSINSFNNFGGKTSLSGKNYFYLSQTFFIPKRKTNKQQTNNLQNNVPSLSQSFHDQGENILVGLCQEIANYSQIRSTILTGNEQLNVFFQTNVTFTLLFRASDYNFSAKIFHEICDFIENTVIVCRTSNDKLVGGYTSQSWDEQFQNNSTYFKSDQSAFLFSIDRMQKYLVEQSSKNKGICCFKGYGPTFGGGYDLQIGDNTFVEANTACYFPKSFHSKDKSKTPSREAVFGTKKKQMKLKQYEVYKVNFISETRNKITKRRGDSLKNAQKYKLVNQMFNLSVNKENKYSTQEKFQQ